MVSDTLIKTKTTAQRPRVSASVQHLRQSYDAQRRPAWHAEWVESLSTLDDLTGLSNRQGLHNALTREIARTARTEATNGLVLFIDLENISFIRTQYGTDAADKALCLMADTLNKNIRKMDLAARLQDGDFALLMANANPLSTAGRAQSLSLLLNGLQLRHQGHTIPLHASIAMHPYNAKSDATTLLQKQKPLSEQHIHIERAALTRAILNQDLQV